MASYMDYGSGHGGLFFSNYSSGLGGLGNHLGNLDRLTASNPSSGHRGYEPPHYRTYDIFNLPKIIRQDDIFLSDDDEENAPKPRLPLFSRCPLTNRATFESPTAGGKMKSALSLSPMKNLNLGSPIKNRSPAKRALDMANGHTSPRLPLNLGAQTSPRVPLLNLANNLANQCNRLPNVSEPCKISYSQIAKKPAEPESVSPTSLSPLSFKAAAAAAKSTAIKLSLDDVKDDSLVALTNKHGKGKYWFKSGCPTPDPRWSSIQQLMIGPIPGDVEYSTLRSAFLSKGHTIHLFIQNNQAWLEKNQEKFGKKQVKFGYVVYTDAMVAQRLLAAGHVVVGHAKVAVKQMDGQPAQFVN